MAAVLAGSLAGWIAKRTDAGISSGLSKVQDVRILDVLALGPFMVYMSTKVTAPEGARWLLAFAGAATITYNGRNFLEIRGTDATQNI
jgi:hypothetical protein